MPYPEPLHALRPLSDSFAVALVLAPPALAGAGQARLHVRSTASHGRAATPCSHPALEALRVSNPAACALPLLQALAGARPADAGAGADADADADAFSAKLVLAGLPGQVLCLAVQRPTPAGPA